MHIGPYITCLSGGAKLLVEVENMAALQSFTLGGSGNLGDVRCCEVHSE